MKVHCLFEQSGTFKNEFKKLRYEAFDYDVSQMILDKRISKLIYSMRYVKHTRGRINI